MGLCFVIIFVITVTSFNQIVNCSDENAAVDLMTYIDQLKDTIKDTKELADLIRIAVSTDIRAIDPVIKEWGTSKYSSIMDDFVEDRSKLTKQNARCILDGSFDVTDALDIDEEDLEDTCTFYPDDIDELEEEYQNLLYAEAAANKLPLDLISSNVWCTNNMDEPECYDEVAQNIAHHAFKIKMIVTPVNNIVADLQGEFRETVNDCRAQVLMHFDQIAQFMKIVVQDCLKKSSHHRNTKRLFDEF